MSLSWTYPKNILDELCIQDTRFFLPLPHSPDLNPIEQAWAILKKVTDLLREVPNIFECLERFLKLNDYKINNNLEREVRL